MSCLKYRDSVVLLVDGELSDDAANGVQSHLMGCDDCRAFAREIERLAALLTPSIASTPTNEETRFWRKFDADLAVRVARGEIPWWKRSIAIPVPAIGALALVVIATGAIAGTARRQAQQMESRARQLSAVLREARESTVFPATVRVPKDLQLDETPVRTVEFAASGMAAAAAPVLAPARTLPASAINSFPPGQHPVTPRSSIRFVDSDGVLAPADLY